MSFGDGWEVGQCVGGEGGEDENVGDAFHGRCRGRGVIGEGAFEYSREV